MKLLRNLSPAIMGLLAAVAGLLYARHIRRQGRRHANPAILPLTLNSLGPRRLRRPVAAWSCRRGAAQGW
jgi:hypothetical protein